MNAFVRTPPAADEAVAVHAVPPPPAWIGTLQLILGLVAFIAAVALIVAGALNRSLQADVVAGQAKIANAQAAANVNNNLIRLLAKAAAEKNDTGIRDLLARNGITFSAAAPAANTSGGAKP